MSHKNVHTKEELTAFQAVNPPYIYTFQDENIGELPCDLKYLIQSIEKSIFITKLTDNWDGEGSEGYDVSTWIHSIKFLLNYGTSIYENFDYKIDSPKIYPGPNGSIDIGWETSFYDLIINISKSGQLASYYGDNKNNQMTEGAFNPTNFNIQLLPLAVQFTNN